MTIGEYIYKYRVNNNISQRQLAEKCGVSNAYISMLEKGVNPTTGKPIILSLPSIKKIARGLNTTVDAIFDTVDIDIKLNPGMNTTSIPLVGSIACGRPILAEDNIEEYIPIQRGIKCDFALRCKGDSMINARIFDGDIVFIRQQDDVDNGTIAAVLIEDEATLKKVYKYHNRVELRAENPLMPTIELEGPELENFKIIGKAVYFLSEIR